MSRLGLSVGLSVLVASLPCVASAGVGGQGTNLQGTNLQGTNLQGTNLQGTNLQGTNLQGTNLQGTNLQGTNLQSVGLSGTTLYGWWWDAARGYWTYRYPDYYYIYLNGSWLGPYYTGGLVGSRMTGTLSNGMTIELYMASVRRDTSTNTMVNPSYRSNSDVYLYEMWARVDAGWVYLCPGDHLGTFTSGTWDSNAPEFDFAYSSSGTTFACSSGVISKCMRGWGYKPWKTLTDAAGRSHPMRPFHHRCMLAGRADYCGLNESFTQDGTLVDLFDNFGFNTKLSENAPHGMFATESLWNGEHAWTLELTRYESIESSLSCTPSISGSEDWSYDNLSCTPTTPEDCENDLPIGNELMYNLAWSPQYQQFAYDNNNRQVQVASSTYCSHNTCSVGPRMHSTCNACTRNICAADPYCCDTYWDSICTSEVQSGNYCGTQTCSNTAP